MLHRVEGQKQRSKVDSHKTDSKNIVGQHAEPIFIFPFLTVSVIQLYVCVFAQTPLATILLSQRLDDRLLKTWNSKSIYEEAPFLNGEEYLIFTGKKLSQNRIIQEFWNILTELSPIFAQFLMGFQLNPTIFWKINWIRNIGEKYKNGVSSNQALNLLIHLLQNKKLYTHHIGLQWGAFLRSFFFWRGNTSLYAREEANTSNWQPNCEESNMQRQTKLTSQGVPFIYSCKKNDYFLINSNFTWRFLLCVFRIAK